VLLLLRATGDRMMPGGGYGVVAFCEPCFKLVEEEDNGDEEEGF
jgi:hypothetical protein